VRHVQCLMGVCMHAHVQVMETPNAFPLQLLHAHTLVACGRFEEVRLLQCVAACCGGVQSFMRYML